MDKQSNPYEAPELNVSPSDALAESAGTAPEYRLFSPVGVALATFLGSILAGGIVLAINYNRIGRTSTAWIVVICGVVGTALVLAIGVLLPENIPSTPIVAVQVVFMYSIAKSSLAKTLNRHRRNRGHLASNWGAAGIGALCCVVLGAGLIGFILWEEQAMGTSYSLNSNDDIYYSGEATEEDAEALGRALTDLEYLGDDEGADVLLSKSASGYTITFLLIDGAWDDEQTVDYYRSLGESLAYDRFGRPLTVVLSDQWRDIQKTLTIE